MTEESQDSIHLHDNIQTPFVHQEQKGGRNFACEDDELKSENNAT